MNALATTLLVCYVAVIAVFCVYGLHRYWLLWLFLRSRGLGGAAREPDRRFEDLPPVTVQIPMFNEPAVAERIITAACAIDYPRDKLQVQVLDDSTDESAATAEACCRRMAAAGHDVQYIHRDDRAGFKAGALAHGLESATGEFIAVFDADFVPPPDVLQRTIHHFTDPPLGMVQMRWGHLNRDQSLLTRIQAMCLDGHFIIEQTVRARTGRWFNFNGTAGVWRRYAIEDSGGWRHETLTEDTDLSYRAQLAGWRFRYLPDVICPAEIPPTVGALMTQQHRWNKGLVQTAMRLLPRIMRSDAPLRAKLEAWFHLTSPLPYAALLLLTLLILPAFFIDLPATGISAATALTLGVCCLGLGTLAACAFGVAGQWAQGRATLPAVLCLPAMMAVGVGVSVLNTKAIIEALIGHKSPFVRTPKFGDAAGSDARVRSRAKKRRIPMGTIELMLGLLMLACIGITITRPSTLVGLPFIFLFACGYLMIGLPPLRRFLQRA